jgi:hypothetical protein
MIVLGAPIWEKRMATVDEITGGSPCAASTFAGPDGRSRRPSENEHEIARSQGRYGAEVWTADLSGGSTIAAQLVIGKTRA